MKSGEDPPTLGARGFWLVVFAVLQAVKMLVDWALEHVETKVKGEAKGDKGKDPP